MAKIHSLKKLFHYKEGNFKTFLFFLGFTTLLWTFIKFSKNYTHQITANLVYENVPETKILNKRSDSTLGLVLTGNGFKLMNYQMFPPRVTIDLSKAQIKDPEEAYFITGRYGENFKDQLNYSGEIKDFDTDTLRIYFDKNSYKKIPVIIKQEISFVTGYSSSKGVVLVPDSVVVNGPQSIVDTIQSIQTKTINYSDVKKDFSLDVILDLERISSEVHIVPEKLQGFVEVDKYTEGTMTVPIKVIAAKSKKIKIFPKEASLSFNVSLREYGNITPSDFEVIANYKSADKADAFIPLEIIKQPETVQNVRLKRKRVQFVILK